MKKPWPRLSETLPHCAPVVCGQCGCTEENCRADLELWQEFDESDQPENIWFWLCGDCSKKIIVPHPRLYSRVCDNTPAPGAMRICGDCPHRTGCRCSQTLKNGGAGIRIMAVQPLVVHIYRRGPGARSEWNRSFSMPPSGCTGKTPWPPPNETPSISP